MPSFLGSAGFAHDHPDRLGILLVNLGTPDAPTPAAVRRFLAEFLADPRVVEVPRWLWWLVLHGVILRFRPSRSAHAYQQIWTEQGSPLLLHSQAIAAKLNERLDPKSGALVALGMTYGNPSISGALRSLRDQGARRLLVLPLYPQYSATTTASVFDAISTELQRWRWIPELRFVNSYFDQPEYLLSIASSIVDHRRTNADSHLLFSFHGIPQRYMMAGDPYHCQCLKTARQVSQLAGLRDDQWTVSFQSQVGRQEWLRPYTDELLSQFARDGKRRVTVICPGFATDCLETLEEIAIRNRDTFMANGGEFYDYIPALNASEHQIQLLTAVINRHAQGWFKKRDGEELSATKARAVKAGAEG
jgi:protoporphyrin/coproporphyrin ferrochelatase